MLKNVKVSVKLAIGFGALVVAIIMVAAVASKAFISINSDINKMMNTNYEKVVLASKVKDLINSTTIGYCTISQCSATPKDSLRMLLRNYTREADLSLDRMFTMASVASEERNLFDALRNRRAEFRQAVNDINSLLDNNELGSAYSLIMSDYMVKQDEYLRVVNRIVDFQTRSMSRCGQTIDRDIKKSRNLLLGTALLVLLLAIPFSYLIIRSISKSLKICVHDAVALANGETDLEIVVDSKDEMGLLESAMLNMRRKVDILYDDVAFISGEVLNGRMGSRIDVKKYKGDYEKIAKKINDILDLIAVKPNGV